jgi:membrane protease YdiL (CAAX protease family)
MFEPEESEERGDGEPRGESDPLQPGSTGFVRSALLFYGVMGCIALLWRMATPGESIFYPSVEAAQRAMGLQSAIGLGALLGIVVVGLSELMTRWTDVGDALAETLGKSVAGIGLGDAVLLALASGTAEEMLFRGALQPAVGLVWASLIFGACHFLPRRELVAWSLFAALMGFALGWLYEWTGHLAAPITAHALVNGINLPRLARRYRDQAS